METRPKLRLFRYLVPDIIILELIFTFRYCGKQEKPFFFFVDIKDKYAKLIVERNDLVDTKDQLIKEGFYLNNKDNKDKKDAERINEIKGIIKVIDGKIPNISKEILHLKDETERLEKEYQQENTLNDVVQNIRSWLKENENMVKAIKKIDTE